jgi:hypothetical protein
MPIEIILLLFGVFFAPIIGFIIAKFYRIQYQKIKIGFISLLSIITLAVLMNLLNIHFDSLTAQYYLFIFSYLFYSYLLFSLSFQKEIVHRKLYTILGLIPVICVYVIGFIALPATPFLVWGLKEIRQTQVLDRNHIFRIMVSGNVSTTWVDLEVYRKYKTLPFLHKEIFQKSINDDRMNYDSLVIDFKNNQKTYTILIREKEHYIVDTIIQK